MSFILEWSICFFCQDDLTNLLPPTETPTLFTHRATNVPFRIVINSVIECYFNASVDTFSLIKLNGCMPTHTTHACNLAQQTKTHHDVLFCKCSRFAFQPGTLRLEKISRSKLRFLAGRPLLFLYWVDGHQRLAQIIVSMAMLASILRRRSLSSESPQWSLLTWVGSTRLSSTLIHLICPIVYRTISRTMLATPSTRAAIREHRRQIPVFLLTISASEYVLFGKEQTQLVATCLTLVCQQYKNL